MKNAETRNVKGIPILVVFAALSAFAAPVIPGEFTDPSNIRKATESLPGDWYVAPEHLKFPYISTYHVVPTLTTKDRVEIPFYVTDWDHSKVRFLDDSFRFDVHFKCICQDGKVRERTLENLSSGDHAFQFDAFPEGEYRFCVWASDAKGRESHRVWHRFRVVPPDYVKIADERTYRMTAADLAAYGIRNDGDLGRKVLVDFPKPPKETKGDEVLRLAQEALGKYAAENPPAAREGTPGYTIYIAARDGKPVVGSWRMSKIVYDTGYDTNAVEQAAIATAEGLQKLLNDKAAADFRKVVLLPGTYRVSAFRKVVLPDAMTLDLNGATLKENAFTGCHSVIVALENVNDAHLVNGTLEGDYYEHDYENSGNNSEWPMGFHIEGDASYCSVENVTVRDITGYGAGNGMGRVNGSLHWFYAGIPWSENPTVGGLDPKDGTVDASEKGRYTSDYIKVEKAREAGWLQISAYLGYQGIRGGTWQMTGCWYDAGKKFLASETIFQYRPVPVPEGAAFLRISIVAPDGEQARKSGLTMTLFHIPYNCAVRNCTFDRCRCVGYAASAMKNFLFEGNLFTHSGESSAKCAFDAEDGWDMMQDVTFRGNRCVENPVNNQLLTCAGHNFIFEKNSCGIYLWPRTYSPCVRDNAIDVGVFKCDTRNRSGYGRFERNTYSVALEVSGFKDYAGWEYAFSDLADSNAEGAEPFSIRFGPTARIVGGGFKGRKISLPNVFGNAFEDCSVEWLGSGRWLGVTMTGGRFYVLKQTNAFERCVFKGVEFHTMSGGEQTFRGCTFENCNFHGTSYASLRFEDCTFTGGELSSGYWSMPGDFVYTKCSFDVTEKHYFRFGAYAIGSILLDECRLSSSNGACEQFVDIFDYRPSGGDATPGRIEARDCTVGKGVAMIVGCSAARVRGYLRPGAGPTKKLAFSFARNKLAPGAVECGELPAAPEP